jgi:hypothetical protein
MPLPPYPQPKPVPAVADPPAPFVPPPGSVQVAVSPPGQVTVSKAGSFAGYSIRTALVKEKGLVKNVVSLAAAYAATLPGLIHDPNLNLLAAAAIGLIFKIYVTNFLDFWLTDVVISPTKDGA